MACIRPDWSPRAEKVVMSVLLSSVRVTATSAIEGSSSRAAILNSIGASVPGDVGRRVARQDLVGARDTREGHSRVAVNLAMGDVATVTSCPLRESWSPRATMPVRSVAVVPNESPWFKAGRRGEAGQK